MVNQPKPKKSDDISKSDRSFTIRKRHPLVRMP